MIWFDYLSHGYVQTGHYNVRRVVRLGKSYIQGVITAGAAGPLVDMDYINFSREWATFTGDIPQVDESPKEYVDPTGATSDVNDHTAVLKNSITPYNYASVASPRTNQGVVFDVSAYGVGVKEEFDSIVVPYLKPVAILHFNWHESTRQETAIVTVDLANFTGVPTQLQTMGLFGANLTPLVRDRKEFLEAFKISGTNQFGKVLPKGVQYSNVSSLASIKGDFFTADGTAILDTGTTSAALYVEPLYINNGLPIFDKVYLQSVTKGDFADNVNGNITKEYGYSGYLVRFQGNYTSEHLSIANTNIAIRKQSYAPGHYDIELETVVTDARSNQGTRVLADTYNVSRLVNS